MTFGLSDVDIKKMNSVFNQFTQIEEVVIYGSRAKGDYRPNSDIDLTLKGQNISFNVLNNITLLLDDLLLPYIIDISNYSQLDNAVFNR
jgi:predicted nucleotidyltransferase